MTLKLAITITGDATSLKGATAESKQAIADLGAVAVAADAKIEAAAETATTATAKTAAAIEAVGTQAKAAGGNVIQFAGGMGETERAARSAATALATVGNQLERNSRLAIDQRLGVRSDFGGAARAADIAEYGKAMDGLRAKYNPLFAAEQAHREQLDGIAQAQRLGAISADEATTAVAMQQAAYTRQVAAIHASRSAITQHTGAAKLSAFQLQQLTFQGNDVATMYLAGASAGQIFATQAGQIVQVLQMSEGGIKGSLSAIGSWSASIGRSALALATPLNLGLVAVTALTGGVLAYAISSRTQLQSVDDALKQHADFISRIKGSYGEASAAASAYARESRNALTVAGQDDIVSLQDQLRFATTNFLRTATNPRTKLEEETYGPPSVALQYEPFRKEIEALQKSAAAGTPDIRRFRDAVTEAIVDEPVTSSYRKLGKELLASTKEAGGIDVVLRQSRGTMGAFGETAASAAGDVNTLVKSLADLASIAAPQLGAIDQAERAYRVALGRARNRDDRDDIFSGYQDARQRIADANVPLPRRKPNSADFDPATGKSGTAADELYKPTVERINQIMLETRVLGMAASAAEAFRIRQEAVNKATADGLPLEKWQIDNFTMLGEVYASLYLEKQKAELRRSAAFERDQIGRSPVEQTAATAMRGLYGDDYLAHMQDFEAQQIRNNAALKAMQDSATAARDGMEKLQAQLAMIGKPIAEQNRALALLDADQQVRRQGLSGDAAAVMRSNAAAIADATTELERQQAAWSSWSDEAGGAIDRVVGDLAGGKLGVDTLTGTLEDAGKWLGQLAIGNPMKNALLGQNLPTITDVMDRLQGKTPATAAIGGVLASSVGSMNVTAASVVINGGVGLPGAVAGAVNDNLPAGAGGIGSDYAASKIKGLNSAFEQKLSNLIAGGKEAGVDINVNSGYRSVARQKQLWEAALEKYGSPELARKWVAPPGRSMHNFGQAADLGYSSTAARDWAHENAGRYGLNFPLKNENWHVEPIGARSTGMGPAADAAGKSLQTMSTAAGSAAQTTASLGTGLGGLTQTVGGATNSLGQFVQTLGAGGGGGVGNILASLGPVTAGGVFASGGYTGAGGKLQPAGIVHRGEVVWSQADIARAGGVHVVEGMRLGLAGYADGGAVRLVADNENTPARVARAVRAQPTMMAASTEAAQASNRAASAPAGPIRISVANNLGVEASASARESTGADGGRELTVQLDEVVGTQLAKPGTRSARALSGAYGLKPQMTRR